jgi:alkanesulfonate monooxygenase SsuD/methylene tetrahydromethanopterin reductase-like flavin-dependent oxidoreductase (luciferase family)
MQFGVMVATRIDDWQLLQQAESLGFDRGWVPDSQMIWSDCYATLALAAWHTSRIELGTGVAIAPTRDPSVTAHSIASINRIAPGRVFLGIGTGHTAMRVMGFDPMPAPAFGRYLRVVRGLLRGEEVEHTRDGQTRSIRLLHRKLGFVDVEHEIPIYVAANGPMALRLAGELGEGRISAGGETPEQLAASLAGVRQGAERAGRTLPESFHTAALTFSCVLQPGERLDSERVVLEVGSMVSATLHFWYELYRKAGTDGFVPDTCRDEWEQYLAHVDAMQMPPATRYQQIHEGHCTYLVPEEQRFVTPNTIRASGGLVGEPDEILDQLRQRERAGLREVVLLPPMASAREILKDFAEHVIERY